MISLTVAGKGRRDEGLWVRPAHRGGFSNTHVVAAMPNGITIEADQTVNPSIEDLLVGPLRIKDVC
ncbi:MAG: hypothetical protein HY360_01175 [Verrucomicrobia bacterium]|nr:hypothetical protein [Verrucomicrobiota bacterium]